MFQKNLHKARGSWTTRFFEGKPNLSKMDAEMHMLTLEVCRSFVSYLVLKTESFKPMYANTERKPEGSMKEDYEQVKWFVYALLPCYFFVPLWSYEAMK